VTGAVRALSASDLRIACGGETERDDLPGRLFTGSEVSRIIAGRMDRANRQSEKRAASSEQRS
jgi:hypothetical protein